jgi:hypothetical protein
MLLAATENLVVSALNSVFASREAARQPRKIIAQQFSLAAN